MRRFGGDERGVTVQIGAILLFGILVLALATYQAVAVPAQNEEVEFNHNQRVQSDMLDLRGTLGAPVAGADPGSVTVELGTTYPARVLFVDPAPPGGALRTTAGGNTTLENTVATNDETADFVGGTRSYRSRDVVYDPSYSVYQNAPTTALEGAVAVNRGEARSVAISDQRLIDGRTISLVVVRGNLSRAGSGSLAVEPRRVSTATRTPVRNDSAGPLNVTVTTSLPADRWERLLADQPRVTGVAPAARPGAVNVSLAPVAPGEEPYTLRVGVVDVGDGGPPPAPAYVTSPDAPTATLAPGDEVTVAVRDRYNNPVAGSIELTDGAGLVADDDDATPDVYEPADREDGVYRLRYTGGDGTLMPSLSSVAGPPGTATVTVTEATGTENATVESGVTEGGTSTYSPSNRTFTLASHNGRIEGVTTTDRFVVEDTRLTLDAGNNYDELESTVLFENAAGERRTLSLTYRTGGNAKTVAVGSPTGENSYSLTNDAADRLRTGDPVDLLDADSYQGTPSDLDEIRELDDAGPVTLLIQDQRGRYDVTIEPGDTSDPTPDPGGPTNLPSDASNPGSGKAFDDENLNGVRDSGEKQYNKQRLERGDVPAGVDLAIPDTVGTVRVQNDDIQLDGLDTLNSEVALESGTGNVEIGASGDVRLAEGATSNGGNVEIAGNDVDTRGATIRSTTGDVEITANGVYDATGGELTSNNGDVELVSNGNMVLDRARLRSNTGSITADLGGPNTLFVDGVVVEEPNDDDTLEYAPGGVTESPDAARVEPS